MLRSKPRKKCRPIAAKNLNYFDMAEPGEYIEIAGGKITHTCQEDYVMYAGGNIVINAGKSVIWHGEEGVTFGDYKAPQEESDEKDDLALQALVKIRLSATPYNGEFCFDWIDVNEDTAEIEKIQDVPFADVEYFYKAPLAPKDKYDLGDMVEKVKDEAGAREAVKKKYPGLIQRGGKYTDVPYVQIKKDQQIELSLEVKISEGSPGTDEITVTGDDYYEFELVGGQMSGKTAKKKIAKDKEKIGLKIKCLQDGPKRAYKLFQDDGKTCAIMGGIVMLENMPIKIKLRVIALVAKDNTADSRARALFTTFKNSNITKYLNENSLNQAGYEVEIENQAMFDTIGAANLTDYYYAFDVTTWKSQNLYNDVTKQLLADYQKDTGKLDAVGAKVYETVKNQIDYVVIKEYKDSLKAAGKAYSGGIIILTDCKYSDTTLGAFSRTSPLNHEALVVFSTNIADRSTYSHEIGHMLGLSHLFFETKEKEAYRNSRAAILGDSHATPVVNGLKNTISRIKSTMTPFGTALSLTAIKNDIIEKLKKYNERRKLEMDEDIQLRKTVSLSSAHLKDFELINRTQTKKQFFLILDNNIKIARDCIDDNKKVIAEIEKIVVNNYIQVNMKMNFLKKDEIELLEQNLDYCLAVLSQMHSIGIRFKKGTTHNVMDYSSLRAHFLAAQNYTMRQDHKNYIDISVQVIKSAKK
jgi:hypothetical protein